ncbi:MAG TPA: DUF1778 domain-containing protein [Chloroflexota bacterium]
MGATLTIRLSDKAREILESAAHRQGTGLSAYVRQIAEAEAKRLRNEEIKRGFEPVMEYLRKNPAARQELEFWGRPDWDDLPDEDWPEYGIIGGKLVE